MAASTVLYQSDRCNKDHLFLYDACIQVNDADIKVACIERSNKKVGLILSFPVEQDYIREKAILPLNTKLDEILSEINGVHRFYVLINSPVHSLIPEVFFEKDQAFALLSAANELTETDEILFNKITSQQAVLTFPLNKYIHSLFNTKLRSPVVVHHAAALMQYFHSHTQNKLNIYVGNGFITLFFYKNGQPECINSFEAETENDALYFVLATFEEFGLTAEEPVMLYGDADEKSLLFLLLKKYIRTVNIADTSDLNCPPALLPLIMASQCE